MLARLAMVLFINSMGISLLVVKSNYTILLRNFHQNGNIVMKNTYMTPEEVTIMKFAFVASIAGVSPETYSTVYETAGNYNLVAGVDGMSAAKEYIRKLAEDGFELINLCGDFDEEITEELRGIAGEAVEIQHADYSAEELAKYQAVVDSFLK